MGPDNPYAQIDPVLLPWAEERGIRLYFADRGDETRSFELRNPRNRRYVVRIDYPAGDGTTNIRVSRRDNRGVLVVATGIADLRKYLDSAYDLAMKGQPIGESMRLPPPRWIRSLLKWLRLDTP